MTAAITTDRLTKRYRDVLAVDHVQLRVDPGKIYALLGLNGAGKTTIIRMLLGMIRPSSGTVTVLGQDVRPGTTSPWSRVGHLVETRPPTRILRLIRHQLDAQTACLQPSDAGSSSAL